MAGGVANPEIKEYGKHRVHSLPTVLGTMVTVTGEVVFDAGGVELGAAGVVFDAGVGAGGMVVTFGEGATFPADTSFLSCS